MYEGRSVAVIIPAYNEEHHVADVIASMPEFVDRIYAVDDASTDGTWAEISAIAAELNREVTDGSDPYLRRVVPIRHEHNRGPGGAVITGYEHALADGIDVTAVMDGDGQMNPADLDRIVDPVATGAADYAKGNRLHRRSDRNAMSRWRLFGNAILTLLTRSASGYWEMSDPQNGYTAISRETLSKLPLERLYERYGFLNDLLVHLNYNRERVVDVSHASKYGDETSGIRYRTFVPGLSGLLARRFVERVTRMYLVRSFHPIVVCYPAGLLVCVMGFLGIGAALAGAGPSPFLGTMAAMAVTTLGLVLLVLGVAYDVRANDGLVDRVDRPPTSRPLARPSTEMSIELASDGGDDERRIEPGEPE